MKKIKRNRVVHAYTQGYKAGLKGHEMESCPYWELEARGAWFRGWSQGRENYLYGYKSFAPPLHGLQEIGQMK
jgi:ribosome modulation factor